MLCHKGNAVTLLKLAPLHTSFCPNRYHTHLLPEITMNPETLCTLIDEVDAGLVASIRAGDIESYVNRKKGDIVSADIFISTCT